MNVSLTLRAVLQDAVTVLASAGIVEPRLEAEILLANVLGVSRSHLHAWPEKSLDASQIKTFQDCLHRRSQHEPMAYIIGKKEFWSLDLMVTPDTLIPRPETELLVETALSLGDQLGKNSKGSVNPFTLRDGVKNTPPQGERVNQICAADLGTGSGAIAIALSHERPAWSVVATDKSKAALLIASENARRHGLQNIAFYQGDWCAALPSRQYDLIVSNPPYMSEAEWPQYAKDLCCEPYDALVSGKTGLDAIAQIVEMARSYLRVGGYLLIEHGFSQANPVHDIFIFNKYKDVYSLSDISGNDRVTIGRWQGGS